MAALTTSGRAPTLPADAFLEESLDEYVVHLGVPGFVAEELGLEVAEHVVTLRGDRQRSELGTFGLHDRLEEWFELPCDVDPSGVTASYRNGALEIHAPRFPDGCPPPRKIAISRPSAVNADAPAKSRAKPDRLPPGYDLDREIFARNAPPAKPLLSPPAVGVRAAYSSQPTVVVLRED